MSYDIAFKVKVEGVNEYVDTGYCEANITWNVREIITASTGLEWKNEENNGRVKEVIPFIKQGYEELVRNPDKYKKYEAPNGYGTVVGCKRFFREIIRAWHELKEDNPELAGIATFWIE